MLTILWNKNNLIGNNISEIFNPDPEISIGISADIPKNLRLGLAQTSTVNLYDSGLSLDTMNETQFINAIDDAKELASSRFMISVGYCCDMGRDEALFLEKLIQLKSKIENAGMKLLLTNRRPYIKKQCISSEKLLRLSKNADVSIAHDIGSSHAYLHALENYYDWKENTEILLLNDNLGRLATVPVGHPLYNPLSKIDIMQQPGWGTAPFIKIFEDVNIWKPDMPMYFNGLRHQNASLKKVWKEINAIMENRVYLSPLGAQFGKDEFGRLLIKP